MASHQGTSSTAGGTSSSSELQFNEAALEETLSSLEHLQIQSSRLEIKENTEVGSGGYGEVLLATMDSALPSAREVAVKQLRAVGTRGIRVRMAFRLARELKIWAQARHPNILELIGFHLSENYETAQLISPFMRYGNVSQYIARVQPEVGTRIEFVG
ncbi:hypothetical protein FRC00_012864 [Tulasnella sp. 408]|nr:hypothetical protein FRC00_012864 [Tulasnella sp. 408]